MTIEPFESGSVRGMLHAPESAAKGALVLTHGAGTNCGSPLLVAVAKVFCESGVLVLRCDLPFRQKRPFGPPSPSNAESDQAGLEDAIGALRQSSSGPFFLAGHSYGGRQASILASEKPSIADALLLLSYPLHPPARPNQLRRAHWPALKTPSVFVHGTKDPFGTVSELESSLAFITAPVRLIVLENAGHDLARGRFDIEGLVRAPFAEFVLQSKPAGS